MKIKSFHIKNLEFVDLKKIQIKGEYFYKGKAFLLGTSNVNMIREDCFVRFFYFPFKCLANNLKELKEIIKKDYDYIHDQINLGIHFRNKYAADIEAYNLKNIKEVKKFLLKKMEYFMKENES